MPYDFSKETDQSERKYGPVPAGSIVILEMQVTQPNYGKDPADPYITVAKSGLRQINCLFTVSRGTFEGEKFYQSITLPAAMQNINLSAGQAKGCQIGGSQIKAICQAANKPMQLASFGAMNGWKFPAKLRINRSRPFLTRNGAIIWHNELDRIITPSMPEYNAVRNPPFEIIDENGITGFDLSQDEYDALCAKSGIYPADNSNDGYQGHDASDNPFGDTQQPSYDDVPF